MATATNSCRICEVRHVTKPSVVWCPECDEGFCSDCVEHHSLAKATRHHKTITIAEYQMLPPDVLQIPQSCTNHGEKFLLYCIDHGMPCCGKCAIEGHKGCNKIVNLDDIIKNAKTSASFYEIEETLAEVMDNIKVILTIYRKILLHYQKTGSRLKSRFRKFVLRSIPTSIKCRITVVSKPTKAALRGRKKKQAQIDIPKEQTNNIDNITARLQQTIKTTATKVRGYCILSDGRMAFTCYERYNLILINVDGSNAFEVAIPGAYDVAKGATDNTVIVSSSDILKSGISIVDIQDKEIRKFIYVDSQCYSLAERNGHVICCSLSGMKMLNLHTEVISTITTEGVSSTSYIDTNGKNIYFTSYYGYSVTCCDFQGVIKLTFEESTILKNPRGISVDNDGFVYVISKYSVILISPCGAAGIQKKLVDEIREVEETERRNVAQLVETLEEKGNNLTKYQHSIVNIKQHASDL
ncbi:unnamed protein product [Mytilus edulis]|uniref:B box-type domain-containing protein n=1 Tax=Mytilus edulis TaxID=6550 RepID=A0A8S3Q8S2_MYTED|nr:unnamed protein product [Mytilus edulis]